MYAIRSYYVLRHPRCRSSLADFTSGQFAKVLATHKDSAQVKTVLLCSGRIYYDLLEQLEKSSRNDLALIRIDRITSYNVCYTKLLRSLKYTKQTFLVNLL